MVEQDRKVIGDVGYPASRQPSRSAITRPVGHQVADPEATQDGRIGVAVEPRPWRALQPQDRGAARFAPPAPSHGSAAASLELTVFVKQAVFSLRHWISLSPSMEQTGSILIRHVHELSKPVDQFRNGNTLLLG